MASGFAPSAAAYKDLVYFVTGNGVDETHSKVPAPDAPSLVCFDKNTGKLVWKDNSPGKEILAYQIYSPLVAEVKGRAQVIAPQGAIYLSVRVAIPNQTNEATRQLLLARAGLAVVPFQAFGLREDSGWFRISVGAVSLAEIDAAFPRLRAALPRR